MKNERNKGRKFIRENVKKPKPRLQKRKHTEQNITERKRAEEKIQRANRVYAVISQIYQAIVRTRDKDKLFEEVCHIAVENGKFKMAWIGIVDEETKLVQPVTFSGVEDGYLSTIKKISISDVPEGRGPTGTAIREGKHFVCNDIADDPRMTPWKDEALKRGYHSSIALPLKRFGRVIGTFSLYASTPQFFNQEEIVLLDEVTNDISFALESIETEKKRKEAEEALHESEQRLSSIYDTVGDVIYHLTVEAQDKYRFISINQAFCNLTGLSEEMVVGKLVNEVIPEPSLSMVLGKYRQAIEENSIIRWEETSDYPTGRLVGDVSIAPIVDDKGRCTHLVGSVHDITERKRVEGALRESEDKFKYVFDHSLIGKSITFPSGEIHVNRAFCEMLGYSPEELQNQKWQDITHHDDIELTQRAINPLLNGEKDLLQFSKRYIHKNGDVVWVEVSTSMRRDKKNQPLYFITSVMNITERKRAEEALRNSEEKFRKAFMTSPDAVTINRLKDGMYVSINQGFTRLMGYTEEDILGKTSIETNIWVDLSDRNKLVEGLKKDGPVENLVARFRSKTGEIKYGMISATIIELGGIQHILGIVRDITERKQIEEALTASEEKYRDMVEQINDVIYTTDTNGIFTYISPTVEILGGYKPEEMVGHSMGEFLDPLFIPKIKEQFQKVMAGNLEPAEYRVKIKSGELRWVRSSSRAIMKENKPIGMRGVLTDITERKQAEEAVRQLQKLEGLGTLAGGIAHDFNNILGIILGYITSIKRFKDDTKKLDLAIDIIMKAVDRGKTLVQQILTFARKTETEFGPVDVNGIVTEISSMIFEMFPKNITLAKNFDKSVPFINADRSQLNQILLNLCVNARDAMPRGGVLTINTRIVSVASLRTQYPDAAASSYVCIEVSDTGEGMTEEIQRRIFEPFFTTKGIGKGTGLGLSVVFGVVQTHKGFIDVESKIGKGTTFRLYLPALQVAEPIMEKEEETLIEIPGGAETLLVVEDEEMLMASLQMVLVEKGYTVLSAKDGLEAVNTYKNQMKEISLVLTDLGLPRMTGMEECAQIKKINPNARLIVVTGFLDPEMKSEFLKAGIQHFLYKPYDLKKVLKMVREVLDEK
ncbi:MAG: PAS domain S-box protein [Ignavibacteriales bacterium]|nr:PAS domain S-box protein [Ignavibacteriales bacterium]